MSSKLSFRARALDATKALPVYHAEDIPDLAEFAVINRTVPQMPTGMEKEEENEKHLVMAMTTQQLQGATGDTIIPTPNVLTDCSHYDHVYNRDTQRSVQYFRMSGLSVEEEPPNYDMDTEDEEWLSAQSRDRPLSPQHFEVMMDKLEMGSGNTVLSEPEAQGLLKDNPDLVMAVYDYWLSKRLRAGGALIPAIKQEKKDGTYSNNPYIAFRKRTEKMQTRKNRKNDELAYMQMVKLRRDLVRACSLAQLVKDREEAKQSISKVAKDVFKKQYELADWSGSILAQCSQELMSRAASSIPAVSASRLVAPAKQDWDGTQELMDDGPSHIDRLIPGSYKRKRFMKKKYSYSREQAASLIADERGQDLLLDRDSSYDREDDEPDGVFTFRRRQRVKYCAPYITLRHLPWEGQSKDTKSGLVAKQFRFCRTTLSSSDIGLARRRLGRGGRLQWDRVTCGSGSSAGSSDDEPAEGMAVRSSSHLHFESRSPSPSLYHSPTLPMSHSVDPMGGGGDTVAGTTSGCFSTLPTSQFSLKAIAQLGYSDCKMHSATVTVTTCTSSLNSTSTSIASSHLGGVTGVSPGVCLLTPVDPRTAPHTIGTNSGRGNQVVTGGHASRTDEYPGCVAMTTTNTTTTTTTMTQHHPVTEHNNYASNSNALVKTGPADNILRLNFPIKASLMAPSGGHAPLLSPHAKSSSSSELTTTDRSNSSLHCNSVIPSDAAVPSTISRTQSSLSSLFTDDPRQLKQVMLGNNANHSTGSGYATNISSLASRTEVT